MSNKRVVARIDDMLAAIAIVEKVIASKGTADATLATFAEMALERALEIVSEASRHIPDELKVTEPDVLWRQIAGIGNILRHGYQTLRKDIIWSTGETDIPFLKAALLRMQATIGPT